MSNNSEFNLIATYFQSHAQQAQHVVHGIGDDAAIIECPADQQYVISVDTLNEGIHFFTDTPADAIAYKALAVNLSDMAAMGAQPVWFTLALSLPRVDHDWLTSFSQGLFALAQQYQVALIGGDTTRGPLSVTIQIGGLVARDRALLRSGAQVDDLIYVTGTLGDAAYAVAMQQQQQPLDNYFIQCLQRPQPRLEIGRALTACATACIDISDGLAADLGHILERSQKGALLYQEQLPVSAAMQALQLPASQLSDYLLYGGDNYELCFTIAEQDRTRLEALAQHWPCSLTYIGRITNEPGLRVQTMDGVIHTVQQKGFDHFV